MATQPHFTRMDESNREHWMHILAETEKHQPKVVEAMVSMLQSLDDVYAGFGVSQLHHALQTATMARRANASDEVVFASLMHDVGKAISIANHAGISAAMLKPYVSEATYNVVLTHQDFQGRHYYGHFGMPSDLREQYRNQPWFALAEQFTDEWDQAAFDPEYPVLPLEEFRPLVQQFCGTFKI